MKLGGRIAIYVWLVATECGVLYGFAALTPRADGSIQSAIRDNRELLMLEEEHKQHVVDLKWSELEARFIHACLKRHADVSDPSIVEYCQSLAKVEVSTAKLRALHEAAK